MRYTNVLIIIVIYLFIFISLLVLLMLFEGNMIICFFLSEIGIAGWWEG